MIKFTLFFRNRLKRLKLIPKKLNNLLASNTEKEAKGIIKDFKFGILGNKLGLERLKKKTIVGKRRSGFTYPTRPLVGLGATRKNSYANMMEYTKIANGFKVAPKKEQHWTGNISLRKLFFAHEDAQRWHTPKRPALQIVLKNRPTTKTSVKIDPDNFEVEVTKK